MINTIIFLVFAFVLYIIGFIVAVLLDVYINYTLKKDGNRFSYKPSFYLPLSSWVYVFSYIYICLTRKNC